MVVLVISVLMLQIPWIWSQDAEDKGSPTDQKNQTDPARPAMKFIEYGGKCDIANPDACQYYPNVTCVTNSRRVSICRCNYLRTWIPEEKTCSLNVFSPCSKGLAGLTDDTCTLNADCINDTLGINKSKFCRCKKGYEPKLNEEEIPAFCVPSNNTDDSDWEEEYDHDSIATKLEAQLINFSYLLLAIILLNIGLWY